VALPLLHICRKANVSFAKIGFVSNVGLENEQNNLILYGLPNDYDVI